MLVFRAFFPTSKLSKNQKRFRFILFFTNHLFYFSVPNLSSCNSIKSTIIIWEAKAKISKNILSKISTMNIHKITSMLAIYSSHSFMVDLTEVSIHWLLFSQELLQMNLPKISWRFVLLRLLVTASAWDLGITFQLALKFNISKQKRQGNCTKCNTFKVKKRKKSLTFI